MLFRSSMGLSFFLWAQVRFDGRQFGLCGKTIVSLRRNLLTELRCLIGHIETTEELLALIVGILESGLVPSLQVEHGDLMLDSHYLEFVGQTLDLVLSGSHSLLCLSFSYLCLSLLFGSFGCFVSHLGLTQSVLSIGNSLLCGSLSV